MLFHSLMPFLLQATGGLCNRLRAILSYAHLHNPLEVLWLPDTPVAGSRFSDVFQSIDGIDFAYSYTRKPDAESFGICPGAKLDWLPRYADLKLLPEHNEKLIRVAPGNYSAMHIRRTDHVSLAIAHQSYTPDEVFEAYCQSIPDPIYVATDNAQTQDKFIKIIQSYGKVPFYHGIIKSMGAPWERHTKLSDAAIDLFACAGADNFCGSGYSSFTNAVYAMHCIKGNYSVESCLP